MADQPATEPTRVAVVLISSGAKLLLIYNAKWRAFTFPMTKLPSWDFEDTTQISDRDQREISAEELQARWLDTAAHAVVECLGQPSCPQPLLEDLIAVEYTRLERSRRDGADRRYHYKLYTLELPEPRQSRQQPSVWLTSDEIRDGKHRPISPTVLEILGNQEVAKIVKSW
jgi:hypothetical protein